MLFNIGEERTTSSSVSGWRSEDNILALLEKAGVSNTILTMANEMQHFITTYDIEDEKIVMPSMM